MLKIKINKCSKCPSRYFHYNPNISNYEKLCKLDQMLNERFRKIPRSIEEADGDSGYLRMVDPEIPPWCPLMNDGGVTISLETNLVENAPMTEHTPGPWETYQEYPLSAQIESGGIIICEVYGIEGAGLANRHLITAAPDLLAACQEAEQAVGEHVAHCDTFGKRVSQADRDLLAQLAAAIAKAQRPTVPAGETP